MNAIMQEESMGSINRKINSDILTEMATGTLETGTATTATKTLIMKAWVHLLNQGVPNDGQIYAAISHTPSGQAPCTPTIQSSKLAENESPMTARIVFLNGVGSAGKSFIAKALQTITTETFLHVQMDAFLEMLPESSFGDPDGLVFETVQETAKPEGQYRVIQGRRMPGAEGSCLMRRGDLLADGPTMSSKCRASLSLHLCYNHTGCTVAHP